MTCDACDGAGEAVGGSCGTCDGTGNVLLPPYWPDLTPGEWDRRATAVKALASKLAGDVE